MSKTVAIVMMFMCLLFGFLIGYSTKAVKVAIDENKNNKTYQKYPRQTILVKIEPDQQEMLFDKLRSLADDEGFAIRIAPTTPSGINFIVEMWREDVKIIALNSSDSETYRTGIFDTDSAVSVPEWVVDSLKNKLINYIEEIPNVTITEEK
jgi:hypothetical protein